MEKDTAMDELLSGTEEVMRESFYRSEPLKAAKKTRKRKAKADVHYDVICISMYKEDLSRLDAAVSSLKQSGHRKMSRSALIRFALDTMDTSKLPKAY